MYQGDQYFLQNQVNVIRNDYYMCKPLFQKALLLKRKVSISLILMMLIKRGFACDDQGPEQHLCCNEGFHKLILESLHAFYDLIIIKKVLLSGA